MSQFKGSFSQPEMGGALSLCVGLKLRGFKRKADRSRMSREIHVRICGGLEVKFLRSTRRHALRWDMPKVEPSQYVVFSEIPMVRPQQRAA